MVTGESMPVTKQPGAKVVGGAINKTGSFVMRADKIGADTLLSQNVPMVAQAQRTRAPIQRRPDQVSRWFVPLVIAVALAQFFPSPPVGPHPRVSCALAAPGPLLTPSRHAHL